MRHPDTVFASCNAAVVGAKVMVDRQEEGFNTTLPLLDVEIPFHKRRTLKSLSMTEQLQKVRKRKWRK